MARITMDINDELLVAAAVELYTRSKEDTINAALALVATRRRRCGAFDNPLMWGGPDLPRLRAEARREG